MSKSLLVAASALVSFAIFLLPGSVLADLTIEDHPVMPEPPKEAIDADGGKAISKKSQSGENVKVVPYALEPTEQEEQDKIDAKLKIEKVQLEDLWSATIDRDKEVHLSFAKWVANLSAPDHALVQTFNGIVFGGKNAVFSDLLTGKRLSIDSASLAQLYPNSRDHAQAVLLFTAARRKADKLETQYKTYTEAMYELANNFSSKQKGRRVKAELITHARSSRNSLVELAGEAAVGKIDAQNGYTDLVSQFPAGSH